MTPMQVFIALALILIFALIESWIFSLPISIPFIKRFAIQHRPFRWTAILLLSIAPAVLNFVGLVWLAMYGSVSHAAKDCQELTGSCSAEEVGFVRVFNLDYSLKYELINEMTLRGVIVILRIPISGETCFSHNDAVCAAVSSLIAPETDEAEVSTDDKPFTPFDPYLIGLYLIVFSPSFLTGFNVYRLTRDNSEAKYLA